MSLVQEDVPQASDGQGRREEHDGMPDSRASVRRKHATGGHDDRSGTTLQLRERSTAEQQAGTSDPRARQGCDVQCRQDEECQRQIGNPMALT